MNSFNLFNTSVLSVDSFRPQQGLSIMNRELLEISNLTDKFKFPSPTGVSIMNRNMKTFNESMINN